MKNLRARLSAWLTILITAALLSACGESELVFETYEEEPLAGEAQPVTCGPVVKVYPVRGRHNHGYDSSAGNSGLWTCGAERSNSDWVPPGRNQHVGNDIWAALGTPVAATADGTITTSGYNGSGPGWRIVLRDDCGWYHYFYHLNGLASGTGVGARVRAGQVIGTVGKSGATSNGVIHLHYSLGRVGSWTPSQMVNPHPYLRAVEVNVCGPATPAPAPAGVEYQVLQGDLNGDQKADLVTVSKNANGSWSNWLSVDLSTGQGFANAVWTTPLPQHMRNGNAGADYRVVGGDFDGDGRFDLATLSPNAVGAWEGNVHVDRSTGSGFAPAWWAANTPKHMRNVQAGMRYEVRAGDFNGDGKTDLATISTNAPYGWEGFVALELSTGTGFVSTTWSAVTPTHMRNGDGNARYDVLTGDFDGDGKTDLATVSQNALGGWADWVALELSTGSGFTSTVWPATTPQHMRNGGAGSDYRTLAVDLNGDRKTDLVTVSPNALGAWEGLTAVELSTGAGFVSNWWAAVTPVHMRNVERGFRYDVRAADFDGDGKTDLATLSPNAPYGWGGFVAMERSTGQGFESSTWSASTPVHMRNGDGASDFRLFAGDLTGDGKADLATVSPNALYGWADFVAVEVSSGVGFGSSVWSTPTPQHMRNGR